MIGCRHSFRVDRAWKFANICVISKPGECVKGCNSYQGLSYHRKMSGANDSSNVKDQSKKQKTVSVWRPVCTQSDASGEYLLEDVKVESGKPHDVEKVEVGSQVLEVSAISNSVFDIQHAKKECHAVDDLDNLTASSHALNDINENKSLEGGSVSSVDKHSISIQVGAFLIRFVKGKGGSMQKKIEDEFGVKITFPSSKQEESIIIEGDSIETITKASEKTHAMIDEAVKSPRLDYSHFVSLPLAIHPELVDKLINFQNSILENSDPAEENLDSNSDVDSADDEQSDKKLDKRLNVEVQLKVQDDSKEVKVDIRNIPLTSYPPKALKPPALSDLGIDRSIFIKPKTFHLTVLMLKLWNKERVDAASAILQSVSSKVMDALGGRPVFVKLKGLNCMRGPLAKARVLYAPVEEVGNENRLLQACQVIINAYVEAGLVLEKDAQQTLKLHATIMNARHRKRKKRTRKFDSFDARGIFKQYGSEEWGEYLIREAHLSQRFVFDEDGYYHCCASIPFPENMLVD